MSRFMPQKRPRLCFYKGNQQRPANATAAGRNWRHLQPPLKVQVLLWQALTNSTSLSQTSHPRVHTIPPTFLPNPRRKSKAASSDRKQFCSTTKMFNTFSVDLCCFSTSGVEAPNREGVAIVVQEAIATWPGTAGNAKQRLSGLLATPETRSKRQRKVAQPATQKQPRPSSVQARAGSLRPRLHRYWKAPR